MASINFDATSVDPEAPDRQALPEGEYRVLVVASERKKTKKGDGSYLETVLEVADGPHKGRRFWHRFNIENPNSTAVAIAAQELSQLCHSVRVLKPTDSAQLHNIPLSVEVVCKKRSDTGELTNEIKKFKPLSHDVPAPAAGGSAPWGQGDGSADFPDDKVPF